MKAASLGNAPETLGSVAGRCRQYEAMLAFCPISLVAMSTAIALSFRWSSLRPFSSVCTSPGCEAKLSTPVPYKQQHTR